MPPIRSLPQAGEQRGDDPPQHTQGAASDVALVTSEGRPKPAVGENASTESSSAVPHARRAALDILSFIPSVRGTSIYASAALATGIWTLPGPIVCSAYMCGGRASARGCDGRGYALAAVVLLSLVRPSEENFRDFAASPGAPR
jgi:hypothetical protein